MNGSDFIMFFEEFENLIDILFPAFAFDVLDIMNQVLLVFFILVAIN